MAYDFDADEDCGEYPGIDNLMIKYVVEDSDENSDNEYMDSHLDMMMDNEEETKDDNAKNKLFMTKGHNRTLIDVGEGSKDDNAKKVVVSKAQNGKFIIQVLPPGKI